MPRNARQSLYRESAAKGSCPCPAECSIHDGAVPWPHYTTEEAATLLSVEPEYLIGFHNNGISACKRKGEDGMPTLVWNRDDVDAVHARMS